MSGLLRKMILGCLFIFSIGLAMSFFCTTSFGKVKNLNVLVLNSYHRGYTWSDEETNGIIDRLKSSKLPINYHLEYLDWKQQPNKTNITLIQRVLQYRYSKMKLNLILAMDDKALEFSIKHREEMFSNAPIVFCGVSDDNSKALTHGQHNLTGVVEKLNPGRTIQIALKLNPHLKKMYVVYDNSESGLSIGNEALKDIHLFSPKMKGIPLNRKTHSDIIALSKKMDKTSAILLTSYFMDTSGSGMEFEDFCYELSQHSSVPIYHLHAYAMGHGALGGSMISGSIYGSYAAMLGIQILSGVDANSIPIQHINSERYYFDYKMLEKFHLTNVVLPKDSKVINRPFSFFRTYRTLVITTLSIILLLSIFIILLSYYLNKIARMRQELQTEHEELNALYEELAATDETLRDQYINLESSQNNLKMSEERYRLVVEATNDAIWDYDIEKDTVYFSDKWSSILGYSSTYFEKVDWKGLIHPEDISFFQQNMSNAPNFTDRYFEFEFRIKDNNQVYKWIHAKGKRIFNHDGAASRITGSFSDISSLKETQNQLSYTAYHDALTGLMNRTSMGELIYCRLASQTPEEIVAILFIDVDNFKFINDSMGHTFGDKILITISRRLQAFESENVQIFRLGGDEFILYSFNHRDRDSIEKFSNEILNAVREPIFIDNTSTNVTLSMGIALFPEDSSDLQELLRFADIAMFNVKKNNKNGFYFFNNLMDTEITNRINIEKLMKSSLTKEEYSLYYQPLIDPRDNTIEGFEALIRWNSAELGMVAPNRFIPIAEETGFIVELGEWVLRTSCNFIKQFSSEKGKPFIINVNISVLQLLQDNFVEMVLKVLMDTGLDPVYLELEITESVIMESTESIISKLRMLRDYGIGVAIDDFGTGYSSLSRLMTLPITTLKIDKSFIDNIIVDNGYNEITNTIIELGHKLGLKIIAEGVETTSQLLYLNSNHCDTMQGYLFYKPMPTSELYKIV